MHVWASWCLRFTPAFAERCAACGVGAREGRVSASDVEAVLPMVGGGAAEDAEAVAFQQAVGLGLASTDLLYAVAVALHVLTHRLLERGDLVEQEAKGGWVPWGSTHAHLHVGEWVGLLVLRVKSCVLMWGNLVWVSQRRCLTYVWWSTDGRPGGLKLREGASGWGFVLSGLLLRALQLIGEAAEGDKEALADRRLLEAYCRERGLWVRGKGAAPVCLHPSQVVWSVEADPIVRYMASLPDADVAVLEREAGWAALGPRVRAWLAEVGVTGEECRRRLGNRLRQALARWAEHKGPMPRDVEDLYRALGAAADAVWGAEGQGGKLGLEDIPVVDLQFEIKGVVVKGEGQEGAQQPLVGVAGTGDADDGALSWFYRSKFPSRVLHTAIRKLLKLCSPTLVAHLHIAGLRETFIDSYAGATGSVSAQEAGVRAQSVHIDL
jgi:hypothetical protein